MALGRDFEITTCLAVMLVLRGTVLTFGTLVKIRLDRLRPGDRVS